MTASVMKGLRISDNKVFVYSVFLDLVKTFGTINYSIPKNEFGNYSTSFIAVNILTREETVNC